jgi:hypothetical protein
MSAKSHRRDFLKTVSAASGVLADAAQGRAQERTLADRGSAAAPAGFPAIRSVDFERQSAVVVNPAAARETTILKHQRSGAWSLMAVVRSARGDLAAFENFEDRKGSIVYAGARGDILTLAKSLEPTSVPPGSVYGGRTLDELAKSGRDVLGEELLAAEGDPTFEAVAACLPPLRIPSFVGTRHSVDKPTYDYGAFSDEIYVDIGKVFPEILEARKRRDVWEGLVGGWLPVERFLFPAGPQRYWEAVIFAAEEDPAKLLFTQPVWYRTVLVEDGQVKEAHYFYHHLPFPPRGEPAASEFHAALLRVHEVWQNDLAPGMKIDVPDKRVSDFCLHGLAREMITRVRDHPKYGYPPLGGINVFGGYGYSNVDTFQDVFTSSVEAFAEWGAFDIAGRYFDDYFTNSVRDDGSIDTRGPEIGQYGRMLTAVAHYYQYSGDAQLMRKHHGKIRAIVDLFYSLHAEARKVPESDPSYGIIRGWSEHDSCLKVNPYRYMLPHLSNNAEASRGFCDLGDAWIAMGRKLGDAALERGGRRLLEEAAAMKKDLDTAIARSVDRSQDPPYLPAVVGDTPTWGKGRVYSELMQSGVLSADQVKIILNHSGAHGGLVLGLPGGRNHVGGFLNFGPAYARIQNDWIREFLMVYWADMAHVHARGTWAAVESAKMDGTLSGPYATPTQLTIPVFTKWMLVFEEPEAPVVWLARATPRDWLEQGRRIAVSGAPTRFGAVGYELRSDIAQGRISALVSLPQGFAATARLRCRVPGGRKIRSVRLNGAAWRDFDAGQEAVALPPGRGGEVEVELSY